VERGSRFILSRGRDQTSYPARLDLPFDGSWLPLASGGGSKARCLVTSCISGPNGSRCSYVRGWLKLLPDSFICRLAATWNGRPIAVPSTRISNVVRRDGWVNPNYTPRNLLWAQIYYICAECTSWWRVFPKALLLSVIYLM